MRKIQENNHTAFESLYHRYKSSVYSYLYYKLGENRAEEIFQEIFLKLIDKKDSFQFQSKFKTWFWTIVKNTVTDLYRQKDFQQSKSTEELYDESGEEVFADEFEIDKKVFEELAQKDILECFSHLKPDQKTALSLNLHGDLSNEEIASQMNISLGAVKSLIHRGKKSWALCLEKRGLR